MSVPVAALDAVRMGRIPLRRKPSPRPAADPLTPRQRQVVLLLLDGRTSAQAASDLGISTNTVHRLTQEAYKRLGVHNRLQAALALGVIGGGR